MAEIDIFFSLIASELLKTGKNVVCNRVLIYSTSADFALFLANLDNYDSDLYACNELICCSNDISIVDKAPANNACNRSNMKKDVQYVVCNAYNMPFPAYFNKIYAALFDVHNFKQCVTQLQSLLSYNGTLSLVSLGGGSFFPDISDCISENYQAIIKNGAIAPELIDYRETYMISCDIMNKLSRSALSDNDNDITLDLIYMKHVHSRYYIDE